ncbi:MAG: hypothetical protein ABI891_10170 [Acidobacteriota bacterium]
MDRKSDKINRIFLWLLVTGGLLSLLLYGLSSFFAKPTVETITTHAPTFNNDAVREVNYKDQKPR